VTARSYWENKVSPINAASVVIPVAVTIFPGEIYEAPPSGSERSFHKLIYFNVATAGGHFAAWEQPQIFSEELRAGFRSVRTPTVGYVSIEQVIARAAIAFTDSS
jgi:hypothetical protein